MPESAPAEQPWTKDTPLAALQTVLNEAYGSLRPYPVKNAWGVPGVVLPEAFGPKVYDFTCWTQQAESLGEVERHTRLGRMMIYTEMCGDLTRRWRHDPFMLALLRQQLGPQAQFLYTHVLSGLLDISVLAHQATEVGFAARIREPTNLQQGQTVAMMWDNGRVWPDHTRIQDFWQNDHGTDLLEALAAGRRTVPTRSEWLSPASLVVPTITEQFKGALTVISGAHQWRALGPGRVAVADLLREWPAVGHNLMVVHLPHQPAQATPVMPSPRNPKAQT
jgi:hypothetical protein